MYAAMASGNWDIYRQRVGGEVAFNLTEDSPADDTHPAFSPDGELIAFRSEREGGGIFLMGATGESVRRLTDFGYNPAWSPDGEELFTERIAINSPTGINTKGEIWIVNVKTGDMRRSTEGGCLSTQLVSSRFPDRILLGFWERATRYLDRTCQRR